MSSTPAIAFGDVHSSASGCGPGAARALRTRAARVHNLLSPPARARTLQVQDDFDGILRSKTPELATRLDDRSVDQFLRLYRGRRHAALGGALLEAGFGLDSRETTRQLLMASLDGWGDFTPVELSGLGAFVRALSESLPDTKLNARATSIASSGQSVTLGSGDTLRCDATLLAVRADDALPLLPDPTPAEELALKDVVYRKRLQIVAALRRDDVHPTHLTSRYAKSPLAGAFDVTPENPPAGNNIRLLMLVARPDFARELWHDSDVNLCNTLLGRVASPRSELRKGVRSLAVHRLDQESPTYLVGHFRAIARLTESMRQRFRTTSRSALRRLSDRARSRGLRSVGRAGGRLARRAPSRQSASVAIVTPLPPSWSPPGVKLAT